MPLPIIQAQNQEFAQQLAAYRNARLMATQNPQLLEVSQPWEEFKDSAFEEYLKNQLDNVATVFSAGVRERFLSTLGIGSNLGKANPTPLVARVGKATADILSDTAGYIYQGNAFGGKKYSDAMNAVRWFVPIAQDPSTTTRIGRLANSLLGRNAGRIGAGLRSYLGWNWMLGNPQDMSFGEHVWSLTKHMALSYGMDIVLGKMMRNPGKILEHLTSFSEQSFFSTYIKSDPIKEVEQYFSRGLKRNLDSFRKSKFRGKSNRNIRYRRLVSRLSKEINDLPFTAKETLYRYTKDQMANILAKSGQGPMERVANIARNVISNSKFSHTGAARQSGRFLDMFAGGARSNTVHKSLLETASTAIKSTSSFMIGRTSGEVAARDIGALTSRLTKSALNLGGAALRVANITSGVIGAANLAVETSRYRDKLRVEYIKNMMSDSMAYSYMPEMGMSGTERTRAIEAIQNSAMGLRNFLGNEGLMMH
jgi:hypothetical protein